MNRVLQAERGRLVRRSAVVYCGSQWNTSASCCLHEPRPPASCGEFRAAHAVDPLGLMKSIRSALKTDGTYLMLEMNCPPNLEENANAGQIPLCGQHALLYDHLAGA